MRTPGRTDLPRRGEHRLRVVHPTPRRRRRTRRRTRRTGRLRRTRNPGRARRLRDTRSTRRARRPRRARNTRTDTAPVREHRRGMVHPAARRRRGTGRTGRRGRTRRRRGARRTGRTRRGGPGRAELGDELRRHVPARRSAGRTRARRRRRRTGRHPGNPRRTGRRRSRRTAPRAPRAAAPRPCWSPRPRCHRPPREPRRPAAAPDATCVRGNWLPPDISAVGASAGTTGGGALVVRARQRRREHRRGQRNRPVVGVGIGVRTRPRSHPGGHPVLRGRLMVVIATGGRGHRGRNRVEGPGPRSRGRRGIRAATRRSSATRRCATTRRNTRIRRNARIRPRRVGRLTPLRTVIRNPQLVRRLLKPLRRRQQERRLIQIHPLRSGSSGAPAEPPYSSSYRRITSPTGSPGHNVASPLSRAITNR